MSLLPKKRLERIQFFENHNAPWSASATQIGTSSAAVTALADKCAAARAAYNAQQAAIQAAVTATEAYKNQVDDMTSAGSAIIKQIRAQAAATNDLNVYTLAEIPAPATPSPIGNPGTPEGLSVTIDGNGALHLKWKCTNPSGAAGTQYRVFRQVGGVGDWVYLGGSGGKQFVDATVPLGTTRITYKIQATRSTAIGMYATFNVYFGPSAAGGMSMSVTSTGDTSAPKLAA